MAFIYWPTRWPEGGLRVQEEVAPLFVSLPMLREVFAPVGFVL